ncbi:HNH endonuclease [Cronobacter phage vB_CsaM_GAP32]|uniref:Uncharacterized protein n=1 Tax=Cronobacter phage vB_CsaM_GAP32 TaxID=1141136 RepID=K4F5X7_9CAUD|nr:HNH endonuclease [Cronobacter phage vB_CsaM_GAP32]AFC21631.1 hypothetical protein GAP32_181 [Cronobacter phage vB_CsaM_GAP32]
MIYGFGIYDGTFVGKNNENLIYQIWVGMIKRCYSTRHQIANPSYIGTTVSDDWKLYSNFEKWYNENYIDGFYLDKDIIGGSKKNIRRKHVRLYQEKLIIVLQKVIRQEVNFLWVFVTIKRKNR